MTKGLGPFSLGENVESSRFSQELQLLLNNEKEDEPLVVPVERRAVSVKQRAVLVGPVWSADLAEALMEVYSPLLTEGYTLEDVSRLVQEPSDDRTRD